MVRAFPRRLFNIQAVDGVSITLSSHLVYCIAITSHMAAHSIYSMMDPGDSHHCLHSISSEQRAQDTLPGCAKSFLIVAFKIKNPGWPGRSSHCGHQVRSTGHASHELGAHSHPASTCLFCHYVIPFIAGSVSVSWPVIGLF